jgi:Flp pilus assembly protein TadD
MERALALDANHALSHRVLGILRLQQGRFAEAGLEMQRAWELDPLNEPQHDALWRWYKNAEYDSVIASGQRLLRPRPDDWEIYLLVGRSISAKGDTAMADSGCSGPSPRR